MARVVLVMLALCGSAIADKRGEARAHFAKGKSLQEQHKYDEAIAEYQAAYALTPLPPLLFNIAQSQRLKGDKAAALDFYDKYLAADPEGPLAEEAREHVSTIKLQILVEQAEMARQQAAEEAAVAKKRAEEAEAAQKRAMDEERERQKRVKQEEERVRQVAVEAERAAAEKRAADERARQKRIEQAGHAGFGPRVAGAVLIPLGIVIAGGLSWIPVADATDRNHNLENQTNQWNGQNEINAQKRDSAAVIGLLATGGALLVGGIVLEIVASRMKSNAIERAQKISFAGGGVRF
jgi:tetratricopeptide (TPR) repeat protein